MTNTLDENAVGKKRTRIFSAKNIGVYGTLIFVCLYLLLPMFVLISTSLKTDYDLFTSDFFSLPREISFDAWSIAWSSACVNSECTGLQSNFWNSVYITVPTVLISVVLASISGYVLSKWNFKGSSTVFGILILAIYLPYQILLYPLILMLSFIGIHGTMLGLIVVHVIFGLPLLTLLFRNYFISIPQELFNAARIDGAGFWSIYCRVIMPMSLPIIVVVVIMKFTVVWNDFLLGIIFSNSSSYPMTVQLATLATAQDLSVPKHNVNMAAAILTGLAPLFVYFISGKLFVRGIAAGAVKG